MLCVQELMLDEAAEIDADRIGAIVDEMGRFGAERLIGRTIEEIDWKVMDARAALRAGDGRRLRKALRQLVPTAQAIGLSTVARVATDVVGRAEAGDGAALGATFARLERLCESAVPAIGRAWGARY